MIKKTVSKENLKDHRLNSIRKDTAYWKSKTPEERISAVEFLRKQYYGSTARLQRTIKVIKRA